MDDLEIVHSDATTVKEACDMIDAELARETPDGPARAKQIAIARALAAAAKVELVISAPMRREAAEEIHAFRCLVDIAIKEEWPA